MVRPIGPETPKAMATLPGYDNNARSDELDCVPLKHRLKMLLAAKRLSASPDTESGKARKGPYVPPVVDVKKEDQQCRLQEQRNWMFSPEQSQTGMLGDNSSQGTDGNEYVSSKVIKSIEANCEIAAVEKVDACASTLIPCSVLPMYHVKAEVDYPDYDLTTSQGTKVRAVNLRKEIDDVFVDDIDHVVLKERRRLLLSRKSSELTKPVVEGYNSLLLNSVVGQTIRHSIGREKKRNCYCDAESLLAGSHTHLPAINASGFNLTSESGKSKGIIAGSSSTILNCSSSMQSCQGIKYAKPGFTIMKENDRTCPSKKASITNTSFGRHDSASNPHGMLGSALSSTFVNIKAEPLEHGDAHKVEKDAAHSFPSNCVVPVKSELEVPEAFYGDEVDHILLRDRIKLLASRESPRLDSFRKFECFKKTMPCVVDRSPIASEFAKPIRINRRKKRRTATDSVETAMEEDAPGLLQVLIEKGVLVNEIKLYGEPENDEAIDDSEDSFSELEDVISKVFSHRQSQLKLPPLRCTKAEKASYCLACLVSLVEQARYLQFLKWPVEWGWCRDLQSFIFVFERHNRIVLERPEYGFATYFFELVDSVPVHWQIKRLVTAMKLASCSRVALIENKALMVGEDLTEGEARVLTEYGWIPNSGLGTMLNYCERVVHDRKNERDSSEWKSRIGKLLMDGYNGGTIVTADIPKKVTGYSGAQGSEIKLEL